MPDKKNKKDLQNTGLQHENVLEALVIADSFEDGFIPLTAHRPECLLPVANQPLLSYTLELLASCGVKHIYVYSCHHAEEIQKYLLASKWIKSSSPCSVTLVTSPGLSSVGDVLRDVDQKSLFESDFLYVPGNVVSNVQLKEAFEEHKIRREKDKNKPLMTLIMQKLFPAHHSRLAENDIIVASDKTSNRILHYQKFSTISKSVHIPLSIFHTADTLVEIRYDLMDTGIWVCSPQVPQLFTDNFDYQTQFDFIKGILINEEFLGNQIHMHELKRRYCSRVHNFYMYDAVSRDVIARWNYPFVPEIMFENLSPSHEGERYKLLRHNVYLHPTCELGHNSVVDSNSIVGAKTVIGSNCRISNSVVGNACTIQDNCELSGAYVWNNVTIKKGCVVSNSMLCDDVTVYESVKFRSGCIICDKACVGPSKTLDTGTVVWLGEEEQFGDFNEKAIKPTSSDILGSCGKGVLWEKEDIDEEDKKLCTSFWGLSLHEQVKLSAHENDETSSDISSLAYSDEGASDLESEEDLVDDDLSNFQREVKESLQGGYHEEVQCDNLILEVNSSKYAYNVSMKDVIQTVTKSLFEIAATDQDSSYFVALKKVLDYFVPLLCNYNKNVTAQLDCLYAIEEHAAAHDNVASCLVKILMFLYDTDVVTEEAIMQWNSKPNLSYLAMLTPQQIRTKVSKFIQWLQEAEEESDE